MLKSGVTPIPPATSTSRRHPAWVPNNVGRAARFRAPAAATEDEVAAAAVSEASRVAVVVSVVVVVVVVVVSVACQDPVGPAAVRPKAPPTRTCTPSPTAAAE
jgi:hypothetical protein